MPPIEPGWQTALAVWAMRGRGVKPLADLPIEFLRRHVVLPPARSLSRSGAGEKLNTSCPSEIGAPFRLVCEVFLLQWQSRWGGIWWPVKQCLNRRPAQKWLLPCVGEGPWGSPCASRWSGQGWDWSGTRTVPDLETGLWLTWFLLRGVFWSVRGCVRTPSPSIPQESSFSVSGTHQVS